MNRDWFKSTKSGPDGNCVEVAFVKSTKSGGAGECVEVATCECDTVHVRDSKDPQGPVLNFDRNAWIAFLHDIKNNKFNI